MLAYLGLVKPFEVPIFNKLEMFNEFSIVIVNYHLYLFTNFLPDPIIQFNVGWSLLAVTVGNIIVNMSVIGYHGYHSIKALISKIKLYFKLKLRQR